MALVGHISGSSQSSSRIGVTGSVIFANRPAATFPGSMPGPDTVFFVSGSIGGKAAGEVGSVAVFGGDAVISGSLTVGTGSIKITSNDIQFGGVGNRIELIGSDLKFFDATNPSGFTLTSLGSGGGGAGADSAASYIVVGTTASLPNERALTAGTGILTSDGGANGNFTLSINDSVVATVSGTNFTGGVTGTTLSMSSNITGSSFSSTGGTFATTQSTFNLVNTTATTVNFAGAATSLIIGSTSPNASTNIKSALTSSEVLVIGGASSADIVSTKTTANLFNTVATTVNFAGAATSLNIGGASSVLNLGSGVSSRVNIAGDLFVQGNVTAIESTNTKIKDALLLLGSGSAGIVSSPTAIAFASGSVTANQSLVFGAGIGQDTLTAAKIDVQDGGLAISAGTFANYVPIRAGKFELGGGLAFITSSDGSTLSATGNALVLGAISGQANLNGSTGVVINGVTSNTSLQSNGSTVLDISGSGVSGATLEFKAGPSTTTANLFSNAGSAITAVNFGTQAGTLSLGKSGGSSTFNGNVTGSNFLVTGQSINTTQSTFDLVNTVATSVNFAGAATLLNIGSTGASFSTNVKSYLTASEGLSIGGPSAADIVTSKTTANLFNTVATTVNFAGAGTNISVGAAGSGATFLKNASLFVSGATTFGASVLPSADVIYDLGSPTKRWANMYTGDLHLKNDRGDWTIIEESDFLTITNNKNGKRYKFVLQEIG